MSKQLSDYPTKALKAWRDNYVARNATTGGMFSLAQIEAELASRAKPSRKRESAGGPKFPPIMDLDAFAQLVIDTSQAQDDGLVTYGELWAHIKNEPWSAHARGLMASMSHHLTRHCTAKGIPNLASLIVTQRTRARSPKGVMWLHVQAQRYGDPLADGTTDDGYTAAAIQLAQSYAQEKTQRD
jgi:hypothetical protein